ncbi:MAG: hypothetical protein GY839_07325 [candidate division Zixibacteria bacterium]|nr:hypothetical protein [candidate division Zixibacteria bacterium]
MNIRKVLLIFLSIFLCLSLMGMVCEHYAKLYPDGKKPQKVVITNNCSIIEIVAHISMANIHVHFKVDAFEDVRLNNKNLDVFHNDIRLNRSYDWCSIVDINSNADTTYGFVYDSPMSFDSNDKLYVWADKLIECNGQYYGIDTLVFEYKK